MKKVSCLIEGDVLPFHAHAPVIFLQYSREGARFP